ncbi:MAG: alpha/beta fold hydrolase [Spirochaetota bacterium]
MSFRKPGDKYVRVGNINTRYWVAGEGEVPLVCIHGLGRFVEDWLPNMQSLSEKHRVYALDLAGHGRSDKPPADYTPEFVTGFLEQFLESQNIENLYLMGNSLGGSIALEFAARFPGRVKKLVLVATAGFGREVSVVLRLPTLPVLGELMVRSNSPQKQKKTLEELAYNSSAMDARLVENLIETACQVASLPGSKKSLLRVLRTYINIRGVRSRVLSSFMGRVTGLSIPAIIVWGKNDRILPISQAYTSQKKLPGSTLYVMEQCGHMPQLEHPEEFNRLVLGFLENQEPC